MSNSWKRVKNRKHKSFKPELNIEEIPYDKILWDRTFIKKKGVDIKKLRLTNIGRYSIAKKDVTSDLFNQIWDSYKISSGKKKSLSDLIVTDTNGGLGGITISSAMNCKFVNSVEIMKKHVDIIKHNISVYNLENKTKVHHTNYLSVMNNLTQDIIISDPPWGGTNYNKHPCLKLRFNNTSVVDVINNLLKRDSFKVYVLLAPYNFDIQNLVRLIISQKIIIKKYDRLYAIFIIN